MDKHIQDIDSDVEILEPEILKNCYRNQELRLIRALSKYAECQIPKKWEDFQIFIKDVLKFNLNPNLVRSVWVQLHACYHQANSSCTVIEIIDVEEGEEFLDQHNKKEFSREVDKIIHEESKFDYKEQKSNDQQSFVCIEISDEESELVSNQQNDYCSNIGGVINERLKPDLKKEKSNKEEASDCVEINNDRLQPDLKRVKSSNPEDFVEINGDGLRHELKRSKSSDEEGSNCVEIYDDECEIVVKQQNDSCNNIRGIIHERLKPDLERGKSSKEESRDCVEINNDRLQPDLKRVKSSNPEDFVEINGDGLRHELNRSKSSDEEGSNCVEIYDDECEIVVKQQNDSCNNIRGIIHERLKPDLERGKSSKEESRDCIEIKNDRLKPDLRRAKSSNPQSFVEINVGELKHDLKRTISSDKDASDCIEINDDEPECAVKQQNDYCNNIRGIIHERSKSDLRRGKSSKEEASDCVNINDDRLKLDLKRAKSRNPEDCVEINGGGLKHDLKRTHSSDEDASDCIEINDDRLKPDLKRAKFSNPQDFVEINGGGLKHDLKRTKSSDKDASDCIEINDDDCELVVKQQNDQLINVRRIIHEKSKPFKNVKKSSDGQSSKYVEISDEDEQNNKHFSNIERVIHEKSITGNEGGKSSDADKSHYVEISDEEEDNTIVEVTDGEFKPYFKVEKWNNGPSSDFIKINGGKEGQDTEHLQQFSKIRGFIDQDLMSCDNGEKSYNEQMSSNVLINEPNTDQSAVTPTYFYKKSYLPRRLLAGRFSMPTGRKRIQNRSRRSLPNPIKEAEAEALREKLLLDKIIELELPQVMNSFLKKNSIIKNRTKKRKKSSINNTEPMNGTSSIVNSVSEPS